MNSVLVFGAMHMDKLARCHRKFQIGVSNPVTSKLAVGGVGFNIARNIKRLGQPVSMVSCVGDDPDGHYVRAVARDYDINSHLVQVSATRPTATYTAILDETGELAAGLSEMDIYERLSVDRLMPMLSDFQRYNYWVIDANLPKETIDWLVRNKGESVILAAPVSVVKAERWLDAVSYVDIWIGNDTEAEVITGIKVIDEETAKKAAYAICEKGPTQAIITMAAKGVVTMGQYGHGHWHIPPTKVVDVNGAGDSFFAGFTAAFVAGRFCEEALAQGICVASLTTECEGPVCRELSEKLIDDRRLALPEPTLFDLAEQAV